MNNNNAHPAGNSGSLSDKLKGYAHVAIVKGQEAFEQAKVLGHKAQAQVNQANGADSASHPGQQQSSHQAQQFQQQAQTTSNNAFPDLNQFNTNDNHAANQADNQASNAAHNAAANAGYKSSQQGGL